MATITVTSTADSGAGSLRQALADAASGDTIVFDAITFPAQTETVIYLASQLSMPAKSLTIDGGETWTNNGVKKTRVVVDGQSAYRCFYASLNDSSAIININGVSFKNAGNSGVVCVSLSVVNLSDCVFRSCYGSTGGGVLINASAQVEIKRTAFVNNTSSSLAADVSINQNAVVSILDCTFANAASPANVRNGAGSNGSLTIKNSNIPTIIFAGSSRNFVQGSLTVDSLTLGAGASVTFDETDCIFAVTSAATIGAATFQNAADSTGYFATPEGTNTSSATFSDVVNCVYGAGIIATALTPTAANWTAENVATPILIEQKNGNSWSVLTANASGGTYAGTFDDNDVLRLFDGVAFFVTSFPAAYWLVNSYAVNASNGWAVDPSAVANNDWIVNASAITSNGGGGTDPLTGDENPSWVVASNDITPNF